MKLKYFLICAIFFSCTNTPDTTEVTEDSLSASKSYARLIAGNAPIIVVDKNDDTLIITKKTEARTGSYTYTVEVIDTVWRRKGNTQPPVNLPPVANAGANQSITLPTNSITLNGSGSDPDGTISSYQWTGTGGTITSATNKSTTVTGLTAGSFVYSLKVTDNKGATANASTSVVVNPVVPPPPPPPPPTAGYTLTYENTFSSAADLDPDNHGQKGNGLIDAGTFRSRPANISSGTRSEVQFNENRTATEGAIEYDVKYNYVVQNNCHSFQFHPNTSGASANPGLWHRDGKFCVVLKLPSTTNVCGSNKTIQTGVWYKMRLEYLYTTGNGYYRWYIDGVQYINYTGRTAIDNSGFYLKIGFNGGFDGNGSEAARSDIQYDNIKIYKKTNPTPSPQVNSFICQ